MSDRPRTFASRNKAEVDEFIKNQTLKEAQNVKDLQTLFKLEEFRRFVWWFLEMAIVNVDAFTKDAETYNILGRQATAHKLRRVAEVECPEDYIKMVQENATRFQEQAKDTKKVDSQ